MITSEQKKIIKKEINDRNISELALKLNLGKEEILEYLKRTWKSARYEEFIRDSKQPFKPSNKTTLKQIFLNNIPFIILLFFIVCVIYVNTLNNSFVSDDIAGIANNPNIGKLSYVFQDFFYLTNKVIRFLIVNIFGIVPAYFRIVNILTHIGSALLIFLILARLSNKRVAVFTSLIFAVHPILSESIAWIGGSDYSLYGFLFLLSFAFFIFRTDNKKYYLYSLISYLLMLQTSEKTFHLFLIFILYVICYESFKNNWKKLIPYVLLSFIWGIHYIYALFWRVGEVQTTYGAEKGYDNPLLQIPISLFAYLKLIFWPNNLTIYHSEFSIGMNEYYISAFVILVCIVFTLYLFKKNKKLAFWLIFFVVTLLPFLTPFRISWLVAERYVYLGSIGIFVFVAVILDWAFKKSRLKSQVVYSIFAILILVLSVRTIIRNNDWQNEDSLWIATGKTSPSSSQNHNNLGDVYSRHGDLNKAVEEFSKATQLKPNYADAYHNLANTYQKLGQVEKAIENYNLAIKYNPNLWQSYQNLAQIYFEQKDYDSAIKNLELTYKIIPNNLNLLNNIGIVYMTVDEKVKAKETFEQVLSIDPVNQVAIDMLRVK